MGAIAGLLAATGSRGAIHSHQPACLRLDAPASGYAWSVVLAMLVKRCDFDGVCAAARIAAADAIRFE